jgi:hypothetical protein
LDPLSKDAATSRPESDEHLRSEQFVPIAGDGRSVI